MPRALIGLCFRGAELSRGDAVMRALGSRLFSQRSNHRLSISAKMAIVSIFVNISIVLQVGLVIEWQGEIHDSIQLE